MHQTLTFNINSLCYTIVITIRKSTCLFVRSLLLLSHVSPRLPGRKEIFSVSKTQLLKHAKMTSSFPIVCSAVVVAKQDKQQQEQRVFRLLFFFVFIAREKKTSSSKVFPIWRFKVVGKSGRNNNKNTKNTIEDDDSDEKERNDEKKSELR